VVVGEFRAQDGDRVASLYAPLGAPIVRTSVPSAEMVKYASNAFLATKISFINEIANVCEEVGADVAVVAEGMGLDSRIGGAFLKAGIGFGGSCFPKDVSALKQLAGNSGYHFQLPTSVIEVNVLLKRRVVGKLKKHLGSLEGMTVSLLGLAFKPNTDDMREASSLVRAARLLAVGATVRAYDPVAGEIARERMHGVDFCDSAEACLEGADAAVLVTEWSQIVGIDWGAAGATMAHPLVIDGRNALDPAGMRAHGFTYEGIGRV
jgi:UDPglucose 6-dehydrogenase